MLVNQTGDRIRAIYEDSKGGALMRSSPDIGAILKIAPTERVFWQRQHRLLVQPEDVLRTLRNPRSDNHTRTAQAAPDGARQLAARENPGTMGAAGSEASEGPARMEEDHALALRLDTVHNEDCIAGLKKLADGQVDLAFADPPFNIGYEYDVYEDALEAEHYLEWSRQWMAEVVRVLKPDGTFWLAIGDEFAAELKLMLQRELGMVCRSWVVWYYTFGVNCKAKFSRSHAHLFHMVKDAKRFTFNTEAVRVPSARQLVYGDRRANPVGRLPDDTWILRPQDVPEGFGADGDTWYFPRVCGTFKERAGWHGCQMPEQLLGRIVRACSNPSELVLDPFGGSGTTLTVAKKLGRRFVGFELSKEYSEQIKRRLAAARSGDALEGAAEPLVSAPTTANGRRLERTKDGRTVRRKANSSSSARTLFESD